MNFRNTLVLFVFLTLCTFAQSTFTWNVASGAYGTSTSWTPERTLQSVDDILVFNGAVTPTATVTGVPTATIGQIVVKNNCTVDFQASSTATLFLNGGAGTDFDIQAGSKLTLNGSVGITINLLTGSTGIIAGTFVATNSSNTAPAPAHKLLASDSYAIDVPSGGQVEQGSASGSYWFSGYLFNNSGAASIITFEDGSTYIQRAGSNPFGLTQPSSKSVFKPNSNFKFYLSGSPTLTGRTYGNFIVGNGANCNPSISMSADCIMYNITTEAGSAIAWTAGAANTAALRIRGNITVNGNFNFILANNSPTGIVFDGSGTQTITNNTTKTVTFTNPITVAAGSTLQINSNVICNGTVTVAGTLDLGTAVVSGTGGFTASSASNVKTANATGLNGSLTLSGTKTFSSGANYSFGGAGTGTFTTSPTANTVNGLTIQSSGATTLDQALTVTSALNMNSGTLVPGANQLSLASDCVASQVSTASYVDGALSYNLSTLGSKVFPIGTGLISRPITLNVTSLTGSDVLTASLVEANPSPTSIPGTTNHLSILRYHHVTAGAGISAMTSNVTLPWTDVDGVSDLASVTVAQGTASGAFTAESNLGGTTGNSTAGTVTGNSFTGVGDFALGNLSGGGNPLPVELTSFTANAKGANVTLNWNTATEQNNQGFSIERKSATADWMKVGYVQGAGTSNSQKSYSFVDATSLRGKIEYRLKQIDKDGNYKYSQVVEVNIEAPKEFALYQNYPNPFNPSTTIKYQIPVDGFVTLKVYNLIGDEVATLVNESKVAGTHQVNFDASKLASGVYLYKLNSGSFSNAKKFIVMK